MAEISTFLNTIKTASRGEEVRDAIISALKAINTDGTDNTSLVNGHSADYFATNDNLHTIIPLDSVPTDKSIKGVKSGGIYSKLGNISLNYYAQDDLVMQLDCTDAKVDSAVWESAIGSTAFSLVNLTQASDGGVIFPGDATKYGISSSGTEHAYKDCTIEYVIKPVSSSANGIVYFEKTQTSVCAGLYNGYLLGINNGTTYQLPSDKSGKIFTFSSTNNTGYLNGVKIATTGTASFTVAAQTGITLGKRMDSDYYPFNGTLYQIRIYSRQLTEAEILHNQALDISRYGITV